MTVGDAQPTWEPGRVLVAVADLLRALGHPGRIEVIELLSPGPSSAGDLLTITGGSAAGLSRQVRALRAAGLIVSSGPGPGQTYALAGADVIELVRLAGDLSTGRVPEPQPDGSAAARLDPE